MGIFILIIAILAIGFYIGYRFGIHYISKLNNTLSTQIDMLEKYASHWGEVSTDRTRLTSQLSQENTANVATTMQAIIHLINIMQKEKANTLNQEEQEKVSQIIHNAKTLSSPNRFNN